jgi:hypothetical protein
VRREHDGSLLQQVEKEKADAKKGDGPPASNNEMKKTC